MDIDNNLTQFITTLNSCLKLGLSFTDRMFESNASITLNIVNKLYHECIGFDQLKIKLSQLNINTLTYDSYTYRSQNINNDVLLVLNGKLLINNLPYSFYNIIVSKKLTFNYLIINYILDVYV